MNAPLRNGIIGIAILLIVFGIGYLATKNREGGNLLTSFSDEPSSSNEDGTEPNGNEENERQSVNLFFVSIGDNGISGTKIGCDDSLVATPSEIKKTENPLAETLTQLLSLDDTYIGQNRLYNALYQSDLAVESAKIEGGVARVRLSGSLRSSGACDDPRIIGQLQATASQFQGVERSEIYINDIPLEKFFTLNGEMG